MASVTDHLIKLQQLTQTNLELLQALNDALYSKKDHLSVNVGNHIYTIPSFLTLENKINSLQENFENLVQSSQSGEAYFNFNGNSKSIEVKGYSCAPNSIALNIINNFEIEKNDIFKDFVTPNPYICMSLETLPENINEVIVKKVIPSDARLKQYFSSILTAENNDGESFKYTSKQYNYKDIYKILQNYKEDIDYVEYDTRVKLDPKSSTGTGLYVIQQIVDDYIDDSDLNEYIVVRFRNNIIDSSYSNSLTYKLFNETIEKSLSIGDQLISYDNSSKFEIVDINTYNNELTLKVLNGDYINLIEAGINESGSVDDVSDLSKLKFFHQIDFNKDKHIKVTLEEDEYIFISIAPVNSRMNIRAPWGVGLVINCHGLLSENNVTFKKYYNDNVKNVGDTLFEITSLMKKSLTSYKESQFNRFTEATPIINTGNLAVVAINKHLNNTTNIEKIRSIYAQKKEEELLLNEVIDKISSLTKELASISFDDTTGQRTILTANLAALNEDRNNYNKSISIKANEIYRLANENNLPIDSIKYRIRGFFDCNEFLSTSGLKNIMNDQTRIIGIKVQYRYKNSSQPTGSAISFGGDKFIFSDWIDMESFYLKRTPYFDKENNTYRFKTEEDNSLLNEPSFNQIDIPITQGENVDIRLKVVYDLGWPFVTTTSAWSNIVNIKFPDEYVGDIELSKIIEENLLDIEGNKIENTLENTGINNHINSKQVDQDITYFHKADDIASGFLTSERRVIPLKDKLLSMDSLLTELYDEVHGTTGENLDVSIVCGGNQTELQPYIVNNIVLTSYDNFLTLTSGSNNDSTGLPETTTPLPEITTPLPPEPGSPYVVSTSYNNYSSSSITDGNYIYDTTTGLVATVLNIKLKNTSGRSLKIYPLFPGSSDVLINDLVNIKSGLHKEDYCMNENKGVWCIYSKDGVQMSSLQSANQIITFRIKDVNDGTPYYSDGRTYDKNDISLDPEYITFNPTYVGDKNCAYMYPMLKNKKSLCNNNNSSYKTLRANETITIPVVFEYILKEDYNPTIISKTMSFDVRTSLYQDPITYTFRVTAKSVNTIQDKLLINNNDDLIKYNSSYK